MPAYKDESKNTWFTSFYYKDREGNHIKKMKRGFPTKKEAKDWEREFIAKNTASLDMSFESFVNVYEKDMKDRIREHTWQTKDSIIKTKILPCFKNKKMNEIKPADVFAWQNEMMSCKDKKGKAFSSVYLKTLHNSVELHFQPCSQIL